MTEPPQTIEDLLARLERERLEADRAYNQALTVVDHALRTMPQLPAAPPPYDPSRLPDVNNAWDTLPAGPPPFAGGLRGRLGRFVWRLVAPAFEQQRQFNSAVADHLNRNRLSHEQAAESIGGLLALVREELQALVGFHSHLVQYLQTITAYVDTKDRIHGGSELRQRLALNEQRLLTLMRTVERASALTADVRAGDLAVAASAAGTAIDTSSSARVHTDRPAVTGASAPAVGPRDADLGTASTADTAFTGSLDSLTYVAFEEQFRGPQHDIRRRVEEYVPLFAGAEVVLDIGCGRGEFLDALREKGVAARGVDVSPAMVAICRGRGLDASLGDALAFVRQQPDGSAGGLIAIQVVEHFTPPYLTRFLEAAYHALRPGAPIVLETINPNCWMAFFETYIRDLTHKQPLHPETLRHLVQTCGFSSVDVTFRAPVSEDDRLAHLDLAAAGLPDAFGPMVDAVNDHAGKLNRRLFSNMDYVVIGRR